MIFESIISEFSGQKPDEVLRSVKAFFQFPVIPEYLPSEVLMASCYRALGFSSLQDSWISQNGKALWKLVSKEKEFFISSPFNRNEICRLLRDVLLSPEDPKQKRGQKYPDFLFLAPIVPSTALFSNPIRLNKKNNTAGGTPWNVENLFKALIAYSSQDKTDGDDLWDRLFSALSVQDDAEDDFFARIIECLLNEFSNYLKNNSIVAPERLPNWSKNSNDIYGQGKFFINYSDRTILSESSPLNEIRNGFRLILNLKQKFSRWQWLTILDAHLRMSMMAFVMWLLDMHHVASVAIQKYIIGGMPIPNIPNNKFFHLLCNESKEDYKEDYFFYGESFSKAQIRIMTRYARDLIRISFFLLAAQNINPIKFNSLNWHTVDGFVSFLKSFAIDFGSQEIRKNFEDSYIAITQSEKTFLNSKQGRLKHFLEFFSVIRQKSVIDSQRDFIRYDQSFLVRKKGGYSNAPFIVDLGSIACFVSAYCCAQKRRVFTITELLKYLEKFYIKIHEAHTKQFIDNLKGLGLTMDSPDAGRGAMILNPFFEKES